VGKTPTEGTDWNPYQLPGGRSRRRAYNVEIGGKAATGKDPGSQKGGIKQLQFIQPTTNKLVTVCKGSTIKWGGGGSRVYRQKRGEVERTYDQESSKYS